MCKKAGVDLERVAYRNVCLSGWHRLKGYTGKIWKFIGLPMTGRSFCEASTLRDFRVFNLLVMSRNRGNSYRYQVYRSEARKAAQDFARESRGLIERGVDTTLIRFEPITLDAIEASHLWGDEVALYPWDEVHDWKQKDIRGFDISLWFAQELCGLCYATPRKSKLCIKIVILEGKPDRSHPLRGTVAALALTAIENYAVLIGCSEIEVQEPAAGAVPIYESLGFAYDPTGRLVVAVKQ